jgi:hypothetical protein
MAPIKTSEPRPKNPRAITSRVKSRSVDVRSGMVSKKLNPAGMSAAVVPVQKAAGIKLF